MEWHLTIDRARLRAICGLSDTKTCSIEGCERTTRAHGWCQLHYRRWKRHGDPEWEPPQAKGALLRNRGWLENQYVELGLTGTQIADQLNCDPSMVYDGLALHGIARRKGGLQKGMPSPHRLHGMCRTPEYRSWINARDRTMNPNCRDFHNYGGRSGGAIVMCAGWRGPQKAAGEGFINFYADMGKRPAAGMTLERIDNDGGYWCGHCEECIANGWPANCRWETREMQNKNKRGAVAYERVKRERDAVTVERDALKKENTNLTRMITRLQRELRRSRKAETNGHVPNA